jgi:hypothetical protein
MFDGDHFRPAPYIRIMNLAFSLSLSIAPAHLLSQ